MKYHIEQQGKEVVIRFEKVGNQAQAVVAAMARCRQSAWACPSGECMKIAGMESSGDGDALAVRLKPRSDSDLNVAGLDECLRYQLPKEIQG